MFIFRKKKINKVEEDKEKNKLDIEKNDAIHKLIDSVFEKEEKKMNLSKSLRLFFL